MSDLAHKQDAPTGARLWPFILLGGMALLYAMSLPANFTEAEDAVYYVWHLDEGEPIWHPNHLIFEPLSYLLYRIVTGLGIGATVMQVMQVQSLVAGVITLALLYRLIRQATGEDAAASLAVLGTGGSFAFWHYSGLPDTYILPLPLMMAALFGLMRFAKMGSRSDILPWGGALATGLAIGVATLIHQQHVMLFLAAMLFGAVTIAKAIPARRGRLAKALTLIAAGFGLPVAIGYFGVGFLLLGHQTPFETLAWSRGFASDGLWTAFGVSTPVKAIAGLATAVFSPFFLFAEPALSGVVQAAFPGRETIEESFFAMRAIAPPALALAFLTALAALAALSLLIRAVIYRSDRSGLSGAIGLVCLIYALSATLWEPANKEFWIVVLPLFLALVAVNADLSTRAARVLSVGFVTVLFLANGLGAIAGLRHSDGDYWRQSEAWLIEQTGPQDVVIDYCGYICTGYLLLFSEAEIHAHNAVDTRPDTGEEGRLIVTARALAEYNETDRPIWMQEVEFDTEIAPGLFEVGQSLSETR